MRFIIYLYIISLLLLLNYVISINIVETESENKDIDRDVKNTGCSCVKYKCRCCEYLNWKLVHLDGLMCIKVKYIKEDVGISMALNYNSTVIIKQDLSVRRLFPLCTRQMFTNSIPVVICVKMIDTIINSEKIHMCFETEGSFYKFQLPIVKLGCINIVNNQDNTKDNNKIKKLLFSMIDDLDQCVYENRTLV